MKRFLAPPIVMPAISLGNSFLLPGELSVQTKGGELEVVGEINDMSLALNGTVIFQGEGFGLSLEKYFSIGRNDVFTVKPAPEFSGDNLSKIIPIIEGTW